MEKRVLSFLRILLPVVGAGYIAVYIAIALLRMRYPFDLEWMEGGMADHVHRLLQGLPLYVPPSLDFTPYIYPPLYYAVCALAVKFASALGLFHGQNYLPVMRAVSFACSLGTFGLIFALVKRETGTRYFAFLSAAMFAAAFGVSGAWYDLARLDSLMTLLVLSALYIARRSSSWIAVLSAGALFGLAFHAKQSALFPALGLAGYLFLRHRRALIPFAAALAVVAALPALYLNLKSGGWYAYYVLDLPGQHPLIKSMTVLFWGNDIALPFGIAALLTAIFLYLSRRLPEAFQFYAPVLGGLLLCAYLSRIHSRGYSNVLMPGYLALCIGFGLGLKTLSGKIAVLEESARARMELLVALACWVQFSALLYNPLLQVPTRADLAAGQRLVARIAQIPGDVFIPYHGQIGRLAGKGVHAQGMALYDILRGGDSDVRTQWVGNLKEAFRAGRFSAVICDASPEFLGDDFDRYFAKSPLDYCAENEFMTRTGEALRPSYLCLPRK
jgi:hypothetical protein